MIEIRELVIRATVEGTSSGTQDSRELPVDEGLENRNSNEDNLDMILKIINDKKER